MRLGRTVGTLLHAGDIVILEGSLGVGKTTLVQGIASSMGVAGDVSSPTFVIAREHSPVVGSTRPHLIHVDAYRLGSASEVDDLDLESALDRAVIVAEWGGGWFESLSASRLVVSLAFSTSPASEAIPAADGTRIVAFEPQGPSWTLDRRRALHRAVLGAWRLPDHVGDAPT